MRRGFALAAAVSLLATPALAQGPQRPATELRRALPDGIVRDACLAAKRQQAIICTDEQRAELRAIIAKRLRPGAVPPRGPRR